MWYFKLVRIAIYLLIFIFSSEALPRVENEYKLKLVFIYNFIKFSEWPNEKINNTKTINICFSTFGEYQPYLSDLESKKVHRKSIQSIKINLEEDNNNLKKCHVLFISKEDSKVFDLKKYNLNGILTIGDDQDFLKNGGIVRFYIEKEHLRFNIHIGNVKKSGVLINSRLLNLANIVSK